MLLCAMGDGEINIVFIAEMFCDCSLWSGVPTINAKTAMSAHLYSVPTEALTFTYTLFKLHLASLTPYPTVTSHPVIRLLQSPFCSNRFE
ncbi:hypothetical protein L2E82_39768 [Cichorium intybus]|uniref:Uncharacterized protein n=1 Tax=Cichorium intybus TaxID=13427 RepID=A0ACB9AK43_CICIN|nr:hypothetical protein L2E82_39768 [Cichorium intybus]